MVTLLKKVSVLKLYQEKIGSVFFRGMTLMLKFGLIVYLQNQGSVELLGKFNLLSTSVLLSVFIIGFDYYTFSNRKLIKSYPKGLDKSTNTVLKQFQFYLVSFLIFFAINFLIYPFTKTFFVSYPFSIFIVLVFFEHLSQELFRLFIAIQKPSVANFLMFLRGGVWIFVFILSDIYLNYSDKLDTLLFFWLLSVASSTLIGFLFLSKKFSFLKTFASYDFSFVPIKGGLIIALPFFATTIMYKLMEFSNRYIIKLNFSDTEVGIFSFYSMVASLIVVISDLLVFSFLYPKLVQYRHTGNDMFFKKTVRQMTYQTIGLFVVFSLSTLLMIYSFGNMFLDKLIMDEIHILLILLLGNFFLVLSFIPNFILYAQEADRSIFIGTFFGFIVNILGNIMIIPIYGIIGAASVQLCSFIVLYISKLILLKKHREYDS